MIAMGYALIVLAAIAVIFSTPVRKILTNSTRRSVAV